MDEQRYEELTEELIKTIGKMRKELLWNRIFSSVLSVMMLALLVLGGIFVNKVQLYGGQMVEYVATIEGYMTEVEPVLDQLAQVDVEAINTAVASLDVEAINETFESIDGESLNDALTRLNEILDSLDEASQKLQGVKEDIGGFFGWEE